MNPIYDTLNDTQKEAVFCTEGPLLVLAGAGSGKTRVLTHRIAYLIEEMDVNPWNILAITFTNKAAGEMRERVDQIVDYGAENVWVATFHSTCVRILRRYIDRLGYDRNFTIYDTDDQKTVMREVCKQLQVDTKIYKERMLLSAISSAKNEMISPKEYLLNAGGDYAKKRIAQVYEAYQARLKSNNALDFDDLLLMTVELFRTDPEALDYYQERFKYIMVDEYQDTNTVQFKFVSLLADRYHNLCVVGDDDQSIYKFRGANIRNILDFEDTYPDARVIKLEQNYRSSKNVLDAANGVIRHNTGRKAKTLWTEHEEGPKVRLKKFNSEYEEAEGIAEEIAEKVGKDNCAFKEFAVLYRTNAQARVLEEKMILNDIPYKVVGGVNFYQRKEIKDILAYLKTIDSGRDDVSVGRIINVPKRGIGATTMAKISDYAGEQGIGLFEAMQAADRIPGLGKTASKITSFVNLIEVFRAKASYITLSALFDDILEETGYVRELQEEKTDEAQTRLDNIDELRNKIVSYEESAEQPLLGELLEQIALVADVDGVDDSDNKVILMTLHSAKGLEFPYVYLAGMEDGLFPSYMTIVSDDPMEIEEERRLCYVGITRAMKSLTLSYAFVRMVHGQTQTNKISRFVKEIPEELLDGDVGGGRFGNSLGNGFGNSYGNGNGYGNGYGSGFGNGYGNSNGSGHGNGYGRGNSRFGGRDSADEAIYGRKIGGLGSAGKSTGAAAGLSALQKGSAIEKQKPDYAVGDRVSHVKFGEGVVMELNEGQKDYEVSVLFDRFGIKKMYAGFAKLKKL